MGYETKKKYKYDIVLIGYVGLAATVKIADEKRLELNNKYPIHFLEKCDALAERQINIETITSIISLKETDILVELKEGGLYSGLWNTSKALNKGFRINRYDILVCQETIEICEFFDRNPYEEDSEGAYLLYTDSSRDILDQLENDNIPARTIGYVTKELAKEILRDDDIQYLDKPRKDK